MRMHAPGILVYLKARSERGEKVFSGLEMIIAAAIVVLAVVAGWLMLTGHISPR